MAVQEHEHAGETKGRSRALVGLAVVILVAAAFGAGVWWNSGVGSAPETSAAPPLVPMVGIVYLAPLLTSPSMQGGDACDPSSYSPVQYATPIDLYSNVGVHVAQVTMEQGSWQISNPSSYIGVACIFRFRAMVPAGQRFNMLLGGSYATGGGPGEENRFSVLR